MLSPQMVALEELYVWSGVCNGKQNYYSCVSECKAPCIYMHLQNYLQGLKTSKYKCIQRKHHTGINKPKRTRIVEMEEN